MITITYKDKTYSTQKFHLYQDDYIHSTIMIWKAYGWLEEVKENKEPRPHPEVQDKGREQYIADHPEELWRPTPGEIIEVSHDKKYWHKKLFRQKTGDDFMCHNDISPKHVDIWKYARPLKEEIELLNEFHHETCSDWKMGLQVELLTNIVNQLIKANKKLGK